MAHYPTHKIIFPMKIAYINMWLAQLPFFFFKKKKGKQAWLPVSFHVVGSSRPRIWTQRLFQLLALDIWQGLNHH